MCRRAELPPECCLHSRAWRGWCRAVRETRSHSQGKQNLFLPPCGSPEALPCTASAGPWYLQAHLAPLAEKAVSTETCWQGNQHQGFAGWGPCGGKVEAQEGLVDLCHHTQGASVQGGKRFNSCVCKAQQHVGAGDILKTCVQQLCTLIYCFSIPGTFLYFSSINYKVNLERSYSVLQ